MSLIFFLPYKAHANIPGFLKVELSPTENKLFDFLQWKPIKNSENAFYFILKAPQKTFQHCFNLVFWLMGRRDVGQRQINVETTLRISTLKFTASSNVPSTLCISTLTWTTLDNVETTLLFSTSSFTTLVNAETTLWKWTKKKNKYNYFK